MSSAPTVPLFPLTGFVPGNAQKLQGPPPVVARLESSPAAEYCAWAPAKPSVAVHGGAPPPTQVGTNVPLLLTNVALALMTQVACPGPAAHGVKPPLKVPALVCAAFRAA